MPHLVLTHYTELAEDKGIVLLRGDIVNSGSFSQLEVGACLPAGVSRLDVSPRASDPSVRPSVPSACMTQFKGDWRRG